MASYSIPGALGRKAKATMWVCSTEFWAPNHKGSVERAPLKSLRVGK